MQAEPQTGHCPTGHQQSLRQQRRRKMHSGYVLITVIAASTLIITCLSILARQSFKMGLEAADQERMLQKRWGSLSLQKTLLNNADRIFERQEEKNARVNTATSPAIQSKLVLGEVTFDILLSDEGAKLPLNTLYHLAGLKKTEDGINRVAGSNAAFSTRLIPAVAPMQLTRERRKVTVSDETENDPAEDLPDAFRSWGEVFDINSLGTGGRNQLSLQASTMHVTCWGSGQLNFRRASDESIVVLAGALVQDGKARQILQRYRSKPTASLNTVLMSEVSDQQKQRQLQSIFSETSTNFSIWIDAQSPGGPSLRTFTVMKRDPDGIVQQQRFSL